MSNNCAAEEIEGRTKPHEASPSSGIYDETSGSERLFPFIADRSANVGKDLFDRLDLGVPDELRAVFHQDRPAALGLLRVVWALLLGCYMGSDDVCFGLLDFSGPQVGDGHSINGEATPELKIMRERLPPEAIITDILDGKYHSESSILVNMTREGARELLQVPGEPSFDTVIVVVSCPDIETDRGVRTISNVCTKHPMVSLGCSPTLSSLTS